MIPGIYFTVIPTMMCRLSLEKNAIDKLRPKDLMLEL